MGLLHKLVTNSRKNNGPKSFSQKSPERITVSQGIIQTSNSFYPTKSLQIYHSFVKDDIMRSFKIVIVAIVAFTLLLAVPASFASAIGPSYGYVQYKVTLNSSDYPFTPIFIVNETVQPSGQSGIVNLTLAISSTNSNFTYSRDVNSSSLPEIFPYLSGLTNQSLSYDIQGFSINVNLVNTGQVAVTFNGASYQATKYIVSFSATNSSTSFAGNGNITSLPSGLISNVELSLNQTATVNATLISTDLSPNATGSSVNPLGASLLGIAIVAAVVVAAPTIFKRASNSRHKEQNQEDENKDSQNSDESKEHTENTKPSYQVD